MISPRSSTRGLVAAALLAFSLVACGDDSGGSQDAQSDDAPTGGRDRTAFCTGMDDLQSGAVQEPDALASVYDTIESNAPAEIRAEVEEFVDASRAVSEAFAEAGAPDQDVDVEAVMASLTPEQREVVEALAASAQTGELPDGAAGEVLSFALENCP